MKQFDKIFQFSLGIFFLGIIGWFGYWLIRTIGEYVSAIPKELGAPIIAAVATVLVATLTVVMGKYYERKKELDAL